MKEGIGLKAGQGTVIIEPYWNVNDCKHFSKAKGGKRHNRTILECKYILEPYVYLYKGVIIEPYWNVNENFGNQSGEALSHNRTILECKYSRSSFKVRIYQS